MVAVVALCYTLSLNKQQHQRCCLPTTSQSLSSPQQILVPSRGSGWTACSAAQPPCLPFAPLCNITSLRGAFCIVEELGTLTARPHKVWFLVWFWRVNPLLKGALPKPSSNKSHRGMEGHLEPAHIKNYLQKTTHPMKSSNFIPGFWAFCKRKKVSGNFCSAVYFEYIWRVKVGSCGVMSPSVINTWPEVTFFFFSSKNCFTSMTLSRTQDLQYCVSTMMLTQNVVSIRFRKVFDDGLHFLLIQKCKKKNSIWNVRT